jgi:hypothetical protein
MEAIPLILTIETATPTIKTSVMDHGFSAAASRRALAAWAKGRRRATSGSSA